MHRHLKILVIEDDDRLRNLYVQLLPDADLALQVEGAASLAQAIKILKNKQVDIILLDLTLPDAVRLEALTALRTMAPELPIVILTGQDDKYLEEALLSGADDFLIKGGEEATIKGIIRALRHAAIRGQVRQRFHEAHKALQGTDKALQDAGDLEKRQDQVMKKV